MGTTKTDPLVVECASKIVAHLERHIVAYRHIPQIANRMSAMNKFIQINYMLN